MRENNTKITDILALLVFAIFAVCLLLVLLSGARVYRDLTEQAQTAFEARAAVQYITMRVRQAETVAAEDFDGCVALVLPEEINGERYLTRVYCYGGYIRELFCAEGALLTKADGEKILPADHLRFDLSEQLLTVQLDGQKIYLDLTGKEAAP